MKPYLRVRAADYSDIVKAALDAIREDGWLLIAVTGDKGNGKSTLALRLCRDILGVNDWSIVLKHTIFTINEYFALPYRKDVVRDDFGRARCVVWDDFALHSSVYKFMTKEAASLAAFLEDFEAVREDIAVMVITCATPEMLSPKIRDQIHITVDCYRRGRAKIYCRASLLWLFNELVETGKLGFSRLPRSVYLEYEKLKKKAKRAKEYELLDKNRLEELASRLDEKDIESLKTRTFNDNHAKLMRLGLVDVHGQLTPVGSQVLQYVSAPNEGGEYNIVSKVIRASHYYTIKLPRDLGARLHGKKVRVKIEVIT